MARRRRRRDRGERDTTDVSNRRLFELERELDRPAALVIRSSPSSFSDWSTVEDRRTWHPEGVDRPPVDFDAVPVRVVERSPRRKRQSGLVFGGSRALSRPAARAPRRREGFRGAQLFSPVIRAFEAPGHAVICARRKERREVLFAKGKGKGRVGMRRDWRSDVSC